MEISNHRLIRPLLNVLFRRRYKNESEFYVTPICRKLSSVSTDLKPENKVEETKLAHKPVMLKEVIESLSPQNNGVYIDMTFGAGGHSKAILESASNIQLYCLDRDPLAYEYAKTFAERHSDRVIPLLGRFSELDALLMKIGVPKNSVDGILIDAGCSSMQFDQPERGFMLSKDGPLDMRMDGNRFPKQPTAADVLNSLTYPSLVKIFKVYGEEKHAKKIAQALIDSRFMMRSIKTTGELSDLIFYTFDGGYQSDKLHRHSHVATKVFQALRIFVNNELNELNHGVKIAHSYLKPNGRLVTLTFHSLEDRIVKRHFHDIDIDEPISRSLSQKYANAALWHGAEIMNKILEKRWTPMYKSVLKPSREEVLSNPRSRSAKLRFAAKLISEKESD